MIIHWPGIDHSTDSFDVLPTNSASKNGNIVKSRFSWSAAPSCWAYVEAAAIIVVIDLVKAGEATTGRDKI
jgi:hypothetical protein